MNTEYATMESDPTLANAEYSILMQLARKRHLAEDLQSGSPSVAEKSSRRKLMHHLAKDSRTTAEDLAVKYGRAALTEPSPANQQLQDHILSNLFLFR